MRYLASLLFLSLGGCLSLDAFMFNPTKIIPPDTYTFINPDGQQIPEAITADCVPELIEFPSEDGTKLYAVFVQGSLGEDGPAILYFHGNSRNLDTFYNRIEHFCNHGFTAFMVDYRGYGLSEGTPTEEGIYMDGRASLRKFLEQPGVNPERLVFYGMSLGSAVATELAFEIAQGDPRVQVDVSPKALILDSPFASVQAIIDSSSFFHLPVGILATVRFDNLAKIDKVDVPVLIMHGAKDDFIPIEFGEALFATALEPKRFVRFAEADHVELEFVDVALFDQAIEDFLAAFVP